MGVPSPTKSVPSLWPCHKATNGRSRNLIDTCNYEGIRKGIATVRKQLFRQDGTVEVLACRWREKEKLKPYPIFSVDDLESYLDVWYTDKPSPTSTTILFLVDQANTKAGLDTTEEGMNLLLDRINAFPQLGYALPAFAGGDAPISEGRSDFHARRSIDPSSGNPAFELCMLLKYVELNGNKSSAVPWSVRQQLLYQSFDVNLNRESVVLLRASTSVKKRVQELFHENSGHPPHWTNLVVSAVSTLTDGWTEYAKFLDLAVWDIDKSATFTDPFMQSLGEANFKTLQATQTYHNLLSRSTHVLQGNIRILDSLSKESEKRRGLGNVVHDEQYDLLDSTIEDVKRQLDMVVRHLDLIQARLKRIAEAIRDCIAIRSSDHAANEAKNMRKLALQANREARTVKAIALVTLIYLPATFVATFLGMDYVNVTGAKWNGVLDVSIRPTLWIYLALTAPLTLVTLCAWWMWERWNRRDKEAGLEEKDSIA